jgi:hypothetical protein
VRMRSSTISLLVLCLLAGRGFATGKPKTSQRIGDLVVTLTEVSEPDRESAPADHYPVTVRLQAENVGKQAVCVAFGATLKATFGLEYRDYSFGTHALHIRELLPGDSTEGEYDFLVKTGSEPLQLALKPTTKSQACAGGKDSSSAIWHGAEQLIFDLVGPRSGESRGQIAPDSSVTERPGARVFITGAKDDAHQANAIKIFNDRCPTAQITTAQDKANYFVQLPPTSLKQSKNVVVVTNEAGDVIHSGATLNLGNAVKDACTAIMNDFSASSKQ